MPTLEENFYVVVRDYTAGDPMQEGVVWTYLTPGEIAEELAQRGTPVCEGAGSARPLRLCEAQGPEETLHGSDVPP
jgi:hypothetical protein